MIETGPRLICLLIAAVLFAVSAAWNPQPLPPRYNITAVGLLFFALAFIFAT